MSKFELCSQAESLGLICPKVPSWNRTWEYTGEIMSPSWDELNAFRELFSLKDGIYWSADKNLHFLATFNPFLR